MLNKTGTAFEKHIVARCELYAAQRRAMIEKVDPPTVMRKIGGRYVPIHLRNPFLDFVGVWTEAGGRTIILEAKLTAEPRLALIHEGGKGSGISAAQLRQAAAWRDAGAVVAFLWCHAGGIRLFTPTMAEAVVGRKSLRWEDAHRIPDFDFLTLLKPLTHP